MNKKRIRVRIDLHKIVPYVSFSVQFKVPKCVTSTRIHVLIIRKHAILVVGRHCSGPIQRMM